MIDRNKTKIDGRVYWKNYTGLELLELLRKEIIRLGLEDSPSRTELQKRYDKNRMPHPNTYRHRFGDWDDIMKMIGFEYDGAKKNGALAKERMKNTSYRAKWKLLDEEELWDIVLSEIREKGLHLRKDYQEKRDRETTPSTIQFFKLVSDAKGWKDVMDKYESRYGTLK